MPKAKTPRATTTSSPANKQVLTMPEVTSAPMRKASSPASSQNIDLEAQIRERAYELFQERGGAPGQQNEDWLRAEHEVMARQNQKQSA